MKLSYKNIRIGRRTIKTAVAVTISLVIVFFFGASTSKTIFAMLGAMNAMENSFKKSMENCLTQIVGMILGAIAGVLLLYTPIHPLVSVGIGIVFMITLYNVFQIRFSPVLPCLMIVTICTVSDIQPLTYAIERLWDTAIGLFVGLLINVLVLPYDNSLKIRSTIEYLEKEVIEFLEDMFDGDTKYPDTRTMTNTIDEMGSQLGIYSNQWMPLRTKNNHQKLEIFRICEGKSRQLLAQMEVLSRMDCQGRLSADNYRRLKECGADICEQEKIDEIREIDVITNYHVDQILTLRQELIENLSQIPVKNR